MTFTPSCTTSKLLLLRLAVTSVVAGHRIPRFRQIIRIHLSRHLMRQVALALALALVRPPRRGIERHRWATVGPAH
jgi:hypothetical protein